MSGDLEKFFTGNVIDSSIQDATEHRTNALQNQISGIRTSPMAQALFFPFTVATDGGTHAISHPFRQGVTCFVLGNNNLSNFAFSISSRQIVITASTACSGTLAILPSGGA